MSKEYFMLIEELCEKAQIPALHTAEKMWDAFSIPAKCDWVDLCNTATEKCRVYEIKYLEGEFIITMNDSSERVLTTREAVLSRLLEVLVPRIRPTADELEGFVQNFIEERTGTYVDDEKTTSNNIGSVGF